MVKFKNSPDDPTLKEYWEKRDRKVLDAGNTMDRMKLAKGGRKRHTCSTKPHIV
ncbi:hypothetical protein D3C84_1016220 [compost metagenome]